MTTQPLASSMAPAAHHKGLMARILRDDLTDLMQPLAVQENTLPRLVKFSIIALSIATVMFLIWSAITPLKELARTEGQVMPVGYNRLVQHLEGGLVHAIDVHEGDFVEKDQLLVVLDGAGAQEDLKEQQAIVLSLGLQAERLHAMLEGRTPNFNGLGASSDQVAEQNTMQDASIASRQHDQGVLREQIARKSSDIARIKAELNTARSSLTIATEAHGMYKNLMDRGLAVRTVYLSRLQDMTNRQGDVAALGQQLSAANKELSEYQERLAALTAQQRDNSFDELHKVETQLAQAKQELKKREDRVGRLEVRAPIAGYVKGIKLNTIGAVVPAGATLMELVPVDDHLFVEVRILPQQIGRVAVGQDVQTKVHSYDYVRFGTIPGKLEFISAMTFTDESRHEDYYKGRVRLERNYAGQKPGHYPVIPGMTVDADIVTGEKTVLGYLLRPIHNALHNALTEP